MDVSAVEDIYSRSSANLLRLAATLVGPSDAEDLVSDALVSILVARAEPHNLDAYLTTSVVNAAKKHWRTQKRRESREQRVGRWSTPETNAEFSDDISYAMESLSPQQRAIVHLRYWDDLTAPQIAEQLGVSIGSVKRQLARANHKISEELE